MVIERVRFVNNRQVQSAFVASQLGAFQVRSSFIRDYFGLTNDLENRRIHVLARSLSATQTLTAHPALMNVDELWKAKVPV